MNIEEISNICNSLIGVTTDIKWEDHLCFNVGEKIFLVTSPDQVPPTASFKVTPEAFGSLSERKGIGQARYFARGQWVTLESLDLLSREEWEHYLAESHRLVAAKLTKKIRQELGIE